jgi:hypothetical protein
MTRWLPLLIVSLCVLVGCAPATAPLPPLTMPMPDGPQEYRVVPVRWQANTVVTYTMQEVQETRLGEDVKTVEERHVVQMSAVERTAQGDVRVRFALDGAAIGQVFFDAQGHVVDATPTNPAHMPIVQAMVQMAGSAALREYAATTFRRGEPARVSLPSAAFAQALPPEFRAGLVESAPIDLTYTGQVRVGESVVATVTMKTANLLKSPLCGTAQEGKTQVCLEEFRLEGTEYREPASGHLLAEYNFGTATGRVGDRPFSVRTITEKTLDRERSRRW